MNTLLIYVAAATLGIQTGWQRLDEGGMEYIIQLDAPTLDALRDGQTIQSDIPAEAGEIRAFRIVVGKGKPMQQKPPLKIAPPPPIVEKPVLAPKPAPPVVPETPAKPWFPFTLTLLALFASIGANLFLGWVAWGFRRRCQSVSET